MYICVYVCIISDCMYSTCANKDIIIMVICVSRCVDTERRNDLTTRNDTALSDAPCPIRWAYPRIGNVAYAR